MISVRGLRVRFNGVDALRLDALDIAAKERVGVHGPNGSGKTTLLRVLAGLVSPTEGEITGVPPPGRTVLVHQHPYFFRGTARANVVFALRVAGRPEADADAWLDRLGIAHMADRTAQVMSSGERRRVAVARALAVGPEVLLLDEPYAALDDEGRRSLKAALDAFDGVLVIAAPDAAGAPGDRVIQL